jgi:hypothetical protein
MAEERMGTGQVRTCYVCERIIAPDEHYKVGLLSAEAAVGLLENIYDPRLVPVWTQLEDGRVQIDICLECAEPMTGTENLEIRYNS